MPGMAGMSRMRYRVFLPWNAAGGIVWGAGCVLLGYAFASALAVVARYLTWAPLAALALVVAAWLALKWRERRRDQRAAAEYRATETSDR